MINGSTAFNNAVTAGGHPYTARISYNGTVISCDVISCTISKGSTGNEAFSVGGCFVPYIEMEVRELNTPLENKELKLEVGVYTNSTTVEWITVGYFTVTKVSKSTVKTTFTALGRIASVLSLVTPTLTTPTTIANVISDVQSAVRAAGYSSFTISTSTVTTTGGTITESLEGLNARQLLEIVAGCVGGYLTEDNAGNVIIFKYNTASTVAYNGNRMINHPVYSDYDYQLSNIKVIQQEAYELEDGTVVPEVSYIYDSTQPYDWVVMNGYMASQSMFNIFCYNCIGLAYRPATIELAEGDPRLEAIDVLSITDTDSSVYIVPGMSITHTITGGIKTTITAPGKSEAEADAEYKGPLTQQLDIMSSSVQTAKVAAAAAQGILKDMEEAAEAAGTTLEGIYQDAKNAADSAYTAAHSADTAAQAAEEAANQAINATSSANGAQYSLSEIEKVIDVVNWVAEHGTYALATETEIIEGRFYFEYDPLTDSYTQASPVCNPSAQNYYELVTGTFTLTEDQEIVANKYYYIRSGEAPYTYKVATQINVSPAEEEWYELSNDTYAASADTTVVDGKLYFNYTNSEYIPIAKLSVNPAILGLYVIGDVSEGISNYVSSHVSLDGDGLVIQTDGTKTKVRISGSGVQLTNDIGDTIATFSDTVTLGSVLGMHVTLSPGDSTVTPVVLPELGFWQGSTKVAYINSDTLYITQARIEKRLRIGQFAWKVQNANRISLVYDPI